MKQQQTHSTMTHPTLSPQPVKIVEKETKRFYNAKSLFFIFDFDGNQIGDGFLKKEHAEKWVNSDSLFFIR